MVSQWNSSGISSQDSPHCSSATKSKSSCPKWCDPSEFKGRIIFMSMFNDLLCRRKFNKLRLYALSIPHYVIKKGRRHAYRLSKEEFERYQGQWYLTLNKSGKKAPMRLRPDFRAAVSLKNRLHRESSEQVAEPISPAQ